MKCDRGRITEATEGELRRNWLESSLCDIYSWYEYMDIMLNNGVHLIDGSYSKEPVPD